MREPCRQPMACGRPGERLRCHSMVYASRVRRTRWPRHRPSPWWRKRSSFPAGWHGPGDLGVEGEAPAAPDAFHPLKDHPLDGVAGSLGVLLFDGRAVCLGVLPSIVERGLLSRGEAEFLGILEEAGLLQDGERAPGFRIASDGLGLGRPELAGGGDPSDPGFAVSALGPHLDGGELLQAGLFPVCAFDGRLRGRQDELGGTGPRAQFFLVVPRMRSNAMWMFPERK